LKNKRFFEKTVADRTPIPYTKSVIRAGVSNKSSGTWSAGPNLEDFIMAKKKKKSKTPK
jgi:hypothetical protein